MSVPTSQEKCTSCNAELSGQFCSSCGHPQQLRRINGSYVLSEIASVFNFQKGILFTIRELIIRPGASVKRFIHEDRHRLVKPISFIILCSLVYIIAQRFLQFEDGYISSSDLNWEDSAVFIIIKWIRDNYGPANILMAGFIVGWLKVFFRKYDYNFFEIFILMCFVMGIMMLMFTFFGSIEGLINIKIVDKASILVAGYAFWAIGQFFDGSKKINYIKAFASYMLGMLSFMLVAILIGVVVDFILK